MEFPIAGLAAVGATNFTNPLEVMKVRMQLQGELRKRGEHAVHYRNVFHAGYVIAKNDGILALQAGLIPALWFQGVMNGFRLGAYKKIANMGYLNNENGKLSLWRSAAAGAVCGAAGTFLASPMYLVKTRLQALAAQQIAFGHQHKHSGMLNAFGSIYKVHGVRGLFRGAAAAMTSLFFGSASQLTSFGLCKERLQEYEIFSKMPLLTAFIASMVGGVFVAIAMTPLDLVATRLFNQGVDSSGKGQLYSGYFDCVNKIYRSEGALGFMKGFGACYFRLGPHTVLSLMFWDLLSDYYAMHLKK